MCSADNAKTLAQSYQTRLRNLLDSGSRKILGVVGPPGCGKSTLSEALLELLGASAVVVPMDGYHLANVELVRLGRAERKGAEDTFDSAGYVALLRRIKNQASDEIVYAPVFRREIEEPIANAIPVLPETPLVITEGNYLLLDQGHWAAIRGLVDEIWYVDIDQTVRRERLVKRHMQFGRSPEAAEAWVANTDEPNAIRIEATKSRADVLFNWKGD
jgi:pantothenate kinase